jgi:hypothetical protein
MAQWTDGELHVPSAQEFLEPFGVEPAAGPHDGDDPAVVVVFDVGADERLTSHTT